MLIKHLSIFYRRKVYSNWFNRLWLSLNQDKSAYCKQLDSSDNVKLCQIRWDAKIMSFRIRLARSKPMRLLSSIAMKCWAFSGVYILVCFLLYWLYGGILAFFLLCFATTGLYLFHYRKYYFLIKPFIMYIIISLLIYRSIFLTTEWYYIKTLYF